MMDMLRGSLHPELYHGVNKRPPYFEGWYFKLVDADQSRRYAFIPGVFLHQDASLSHSFVQVLDGNTGEATYHPYPLEALQADAGLVVWVGLSIPTLGQISLGFAPSGTTLTPSPATQLILLPIESGLLFLTGLFAGLYFYRWETHRVLALVLWTSSALSTLLFLLAVLFIISTPI